MRRRARFDNLMMRFHDEAVNKIARIPEILGIDGLSSKKLLYEPIKFPQLRKKGQETGDLILIWLAFPKGWEILIAEVTIGARRPMEAEFPKLNRSFEYLRDYWRDWFEEIGLDLPEGYTLWIRTVALSYAGKASWEEPFKSERRRQIL